MAKTNIVFGVEPGDRAVIQERARAAGMSVASWVRYAALMYVSPFKPADPGTHTTEPADPDETPEARRYRELGSAPRGPEIDPVRRLREHGERVAEENARKAAAHKQRSPDRG